MHYVSLVLIFVVATMASSSGNDKPYYALSEASKLFEEFMVKHNREYKDDETEKNFRMKIFTANLEKINQMNAESDTATFGINKFADYTEEEMAAMRGLKPQLNRSDRHLDKPEQDVCQCPIEKQ